METEIEMLCRVMPGDPESNGWKRAFDFLVSTGGEPKDVSDYLIHLLKSGHLPPRPKQ